LRRGNTGTLERMRGRGSGGSRSEREQRERNPQETIEEAGA
jgi:hypothetical protein